MIMSKLCFIYFTMNAYIEQVMAINTLSLCYANPDVFKGEIRKNLGEVPNPYLVHLVP